MWPIGPIPPEPPDLDIPRADAKSRPRLESHDESAAERRKKRRRKPDGQRSFEIDTFERRTGSDSEE